MRIIIVCFLLGIDFNVEWLEELIIEVFKMIFCC